LAQSQKSKSAGGAPAKGKRSMTTVPSVQWQYDPKHDVRDGAEWSEAEIEELAIVLKNGGTIGDAAELLCRQGTVEDVRRKAEQLGLVPLKNG
jgi:hypothetical protein